MSLNDPRVPALALAEPPSLDPRARRIDHDAVQRAARDLLRAIGADAEAKALEETPRRVADALAELLTPRRFRATTFPNDEGYDELIVARSIPFHSLCMHHLLPFQGVAHVGYLPGERIIGLSKLGRVVEFFSRDLQIQERLTSGLRRGRRRCTSPSRSSTKTLQPVEQPGQTARCSFRNQTRIWKRKSFEVSAPTGQISTVLSE